MKIEFQDGSFMLSWQKMRAWYAPDGALKDCEQKYMRNGYPAARTLPARAVKVRAWLEKQGHYEIALTKRLNK